jgi:hypothetical protein
MNMIWHHHKCMQGIPPLYIRHIAQHVHHHIRNRPIAKMKRTGTPAINKRSKAANARPELTSES